MGSFLRAKLQGKHFKSWKNVESNVRLTLKCSELLWEPIDCQSTPHHKHTDSGGWQGRSGMMEFKVYTLLEFISLFLPANNIHQDKSQFHQRLVNHVEDLSHRKLLEILEKQDLIIMFELERSLPKSGSGSTTGTGCGFNSRGGGIIPPGLATIGASIGGGNGLGMTGNWACCACFCDWALLAK